MPGVVRGRGVVLIAEPLVPVPVEVPVLPVAPDAPIPVPPVMPMDFAFFFTQVSHRFWLENFGLE